MVRTVLLSPLLGFLLAACQNRTSDGREGGDSVSPAPSAGSDAMGTGGAEPILPRWNPGPDREVPDALVEGTLVLEQGCLRVVSPGGPRYLVVWPPHVSLDSAGGALRVVDAERGTAAPVGATVRLSGGEIPSSAQVPPGLRASIPAGCSGPLWIAGGILSAAH